MNAQALIGSDAWLITGNGNTTPTTNFIGTTNAADFVAKTNNTERARITSGGDLLLSGSGAANNSGLVFNNFNAATPVSAGATLGVDATGRVVTVQGSSFSPAFGQVSLPSTLYVTANSTRDLLQATLPVPGTYLVSYFVRAQDSTSVLPTANNFAVAYVKDGTGTQIPNSQILVIFHIANNPPANYTITVGSTASGSFIRQVTNPSGETLTLSIRAAGVSFAVSSNQDGTTSMSYIKVTP